jgi:hypothetical protein
MLSKRSTPKRFWQSLSFSDPRMVRSRKSPLSRQQVDSSERVALTRQRRTSLSSTNIPSRKNVSQVGTKALSRSQSSLGRSSNRWLPQVITRSANASTNKALPKNRQLSRHSTHDYESNQRLVRQQRFFQWKKLNFWHPRSDAPTNFSPNKLLSTPQLSPHDTFLAHDSSFNLKHLFKTQKRATLSQSFHWLVATIIFIGIYCAPLQEASLTYLALLLARISFVAFLLKYTYVHYNRKANRYHVKGFRLVISRGLIKRYTGSVPLMSGVQVYIRRKGTDVLFGLYRVQLIAPLSPSDKVTEFSGFSYETAQTFFYWISRECDRQVFISPDS